MTGSNSGILGSQVGSYPHSADTLPLQPLSSALSRRLAAVPGPD